ncbi:MAG: AAA family ATPase, partial [Chlorobiales bacterium]|nr:AAA family ATPase [Chlorobiales bacterium]
MKQETELEALGREIAGEAVFIDRVREVLASRIIGQRAVVDRVLIAMLANGHLLLEGVPGLAKTLIVRTFASAMNLSFRRIQFTPDMLPADLIGTMIYNPKEMEFYPRKGPVFANV